MKNISLIMCLSVCLSVYLCLDACACLCVYARKYFLQDNSYTRQISFVIAASDNGLLPI